jgi:hypothetical protein
MLGYGLSEGQHVVVRRDINGWAGPLGYPDVKKGTRAIVRSGPGWFGSSYTIEIASGRQLSVSGRDLRPAAFGQGEESWSRYKATRSGIRLGMFVLMIPALVALARYYMSGGSTAGLVAALPDAIFSTLADLFGGAISLVGLPIVLIGVALLWLRARGRTA